MKPSMPDQPAAPPTIHRGRGRPRVAPEDRAAWAAFCREARKLLGLSVREMAQKLVLRTHSRYSEWERGANMPRDRAAVEAQIRELLVLAGKSREMGRKDDEQDRSA